jgi:hypothetical protein
MVSYKQMPDRYNKTLQLPRQLSSLRVSNDRARNTNAAAWIVRVESFIVRSAPQGATMLIEPSCISILSAIPGS